MSWVLKIKKFGDLSNRKIKYYITASTAYMYSCYLFFSQCVGIIWFRKFMEVLFKI